MPAQFPVGGTAIPFNGKFINAQDCWRYESLKATSSEKRVMMDTSDQFKLAKSDLQVDTKGRLTFSDSRDLSDIEFGPKRKPIKNIQLEFSDIGILQMNQVECYENVKQHDYNYTLYYLPLSEVEYVGVDGDFWVRILDV